MYVRCPPNSGRGVGLFFKCFMWKVRPMNRDAIKNKVPTSCYWLVVLAIDIYTRAIVGMVLTNWLLPIVNGYA